MDKNAHEIIFDVAGVYFSLLLFLECMILADFVSAMHFLVFLVLQ
jgi:hypothetical protein